MTIEGAAILEKSQKPEVPAVKTTPANYVVVDNSYSLNRLATPTTPSSPKVDLAADAKVPDLEKNDVAIQGLFDSIWSTVCNVIGGASNLLYTVLLQDIIESSKALYQFCRGEGFQKILDSGWHLLGAAAMIGGTIASGGVATLPLMGVRKLCQQVASMTVKEVCALATEQILASAVKLGATIPKVRNSMSIVKVGVADAEKLGTELFELVGKDLADVQKAVAREDEMVTAGKGIVNKAIDNGQKLDLVQIETDLTKNFQQIVSDEVCNTVSANMEKVKELIKAGNRPREEICAGLRELGIAEDRINECYSLISSRSLRVLLKTGKFDDELIEAFTKGMQENAEKTIQLLFKQGKLGHHFSEKWDQYVDELLDQGKITGSEATELKAIGRRSCKDGYVEGTKEGIERGVRKAFERKTHEDQAGAEDDDAPTKAKPAETNAHPLNLLLIKLAQPKDPQLDFVTSSSERVVGPNERKSKHWLEMYFIEKEEGDKLQGQGPKDKSSKGSTNAENLKVSNL